MYRNLKYQSGRSFNRAMDVKFSEWFRDKIETIATCHLTAGNTDEYIVAFNTLSKIDSAKNIEDALATVLKQNSALMQQLGSTTTTP